MSQPVVIIGAGGHAREVLDVFDALNQVAPRYDVLGYIVETGHGVPGTRVRERPILGDFDWLTGRAGQVQAICAVGPPNLKRRLVKRAEDAGIAFCSAVHPGAVMTPHVTLGRGVVVAAGCVLTNQILVADHAHLNIGCTIAHDSRLEAFVTLSPGVHAGGDVVFAEGCEVGIGASIIPRRRIGAWSVVGAGTVVTHDVPDDSTVVGVPGKVIKTRPAGWHLPRS